MCFHNETNISSTVCVVTKQLEENSRDITKLFFHHSNSFKISRLVEDVASKQKKLIKEKKNSTVKRFSN